MNKPIHRVDKVLDLMDCLQYVSELEAEERGTTYQSGCRTYGDGTETLHRRLYDIVREDCWGNQQFSNDSFYRWVVGDSQGNADIENFRRLFEDSINKEDPDCWEYDYFLFQVSW